ncbi:SGNH/GDSL hydrolase family protein, partial [Kibdelosporangium lantanae]
AQSDPVAMTVPADTDLLVSLYMAQGSGPATYHPAANQISYLTTTGDHAMDESGAGFDQKIGSWVYVEEIDIQGSGARGSVVTFGDSITDGYASGIDVNGRYPDELAERLHGRFGVLNAGIGGNRLLTDSQCLGDKGTSRFAADALAQPHVRTVLVLEGINDIGFTGFGLDCAPPNPPVTAAQLIAGHRSLIHQAHAAGVRIVGATLLPFKGASYYSVAGEQVRDELNAWIRTSGEYDAVVDLDRATASPTDPDAMNPAYDSGDHLHPNAAGYHAMAEAVDLHQL